jgi:hypothetical protein
MTDNEDNPCPCEMDHPAVNINAVQDEENLVKVVVLRSHLATSINGHIQLTTTAISQDDISGKKDASGGTRSVSTFRAEQTPREELVRRAKAINRVPEWCDDPISAIVAATTLRTIMDEDGRREVCVYAEPTDERDKLGPCPTHAGLKRSLSPPIPDSRLSWAVLRSTVAQKFTAFKRVCSDSDVTAATLEMPG